jgi:hypothetical protein
LDDLAGFVLSVDGDDEPDEEVGGGWLGWLGAEQPQSITDSDIEVSNRKRRRRSAAARPAAVDTR